MPVVVAVVGISGTYLITKQQEASSSAAAIAQHKSAQETADADRQVKILELFSQKITSTETSQRVVGLKILSAFDPKLAEKLASAVSETESQPVVRSAAQEVIDDARKRAAGPRPFTLHEYSDSDPLKPLGKETY